MDQEASYKPLVAAMEKQQGYNPVIQWLVDAMETQS